MAPHMAASVCCSLVLFLILFVCPVLSNDFPISFTRNELLDIRNSTPDNLLPMFEHSDVLLDILVGGAAFLFKSSRRRKRGKRAGALVKTRQPGLRTLLPSIHYIYIYAFSRRFYPKRLTVHSGYTFFFFFISMCVPWESNPQPFALLTQCSTTEPQEHLANLRTLANKSDELQLLTRTNKDFLNSAALCFTETWLNGAIPDSALHLSGFQLFRADRVTESSGKTRGGGLCFYINEGWCTDVTVLKKMCCPNLEALFINCKPFYSPREFCSFILVSVYNPKSEKVGTVWKTQIKKESSDF